MRPLLALSAVLVLCLSPTTTFASAPIIPTGKWYIEANGHVGVMEVTSIDIVGNLTGTLFGTPIIGFWDGFERRMTFETSTASVAVQVYTGYLVREGPGSALLAGSFEAFTGTGATATRNVFAWRAENFNTQDGGLVAAEPPSPAPFPASFDIVANGQQGTLTVTSIDATNELSGTLFGKPILGFWNPFERKLTFLWYGNLADATQMRVYTGYLAGSSTCVVEASCRFAGSLEAFSGSGGAAQRNVFGWFATFAKK
jgi:hypothetical protein